MSTGFPVDFEQFFLKLSAAERKSFADDAGTSVEYIRDHLLAGRRMPRAPLLESLTRALRKRRQALSERDLAGYFHQRVQRRMAA